MPLSAELEKVVALIQDPTEREARRKELLELADNGLRQADYSRKMNELDATKKANDEKHAKNVDWYKRANDQYKAMETDHKAAQERLAALESVRSAAGHGSLEQTPAEEAQLEKDLAEARKELAEAKTKINTLDTTVASFNQMMTDGKLLTAEKFDTEINKRGDALGAALLDIIDLQNKHLKDFGTELDRKVLLEEAQKRGGNLAQAYEEVTKAAQAVKLRKEIEAEVETRYKDKMKNSNVPYEANGEPVIGPLQARLMKKDTGIPDDIPADGSGQLSSRIAAELKAEGKW